MTTPIGPDERKDNRNLSGYRHHDLAYLLIGFHETMGFDDFFQWKGLGDDRFQCARTQSIEYKLFGPVQFLWIRYDFK